MRLTEQQRQIIKDNVKNIFGSRVNDQAKGGDIDLLIELEHSEKDVLKKNLQLNALLQLAMGGLQKIDIITHVKNSQQSTLQQTAFNTGVKL